MVQMGCDVTRGLYTFFGELSPGKYQWKHIISLDGSNRARYLQRAMRRFPNIAESEVRAAQIAASINTIKGSAACLHENRTDVALVIQE